MTRPPRHKILKDLYSNMHEKDLSDPFEWIRKMDDKQAEVFNFDERTYASSCLLKYDYLKETLVREIDYFKQVNRVLPI
jgi:protease II